MNGSQSTLLLKVIGLLFVVLVPVVSGYFSALNKIENRHDHSIKKINEVQKEVAVIQDELKWTKETYRRDTERDKEDLTKLEEDIRKDLELSVQNDISLKKMLQEVLSRLTVIEHQIKLNSKNSSVN